MGHLVIATSSLAVIAHVKNNLCMVDKMLGFKVTIQQVQYSKEITKKNLPLDDMTSRCQLILIYILFKRSVLLQQMVVIR